MNKFIDLCKKSNFIFNAKQKVRLIVLLIILFVETLLELLGIISVYPFIALVLSPEMIQTNPMLNWLYHFAGCSDERQFFSLVALLIILLYVFKNLFNAFAQYTRLGVVYTTKREISVRLIQSYMNQPYRFFLENNSASLMRSVGEDVDRFFEMVLQTMYFFSDGATMLVFGLYLLGTDFILSSVCIVVMLLFVVLFTQKNKKRITYYGKQTQFSAGNMVKWLHQAFGGAKEIKILHRENYFVKNYEKYSTISNKMNQRFLFFNSIPHMVLEIFCTAAILIVITVRIYVGVDVAVFVPNMAVFAMALFRLFPRISRLNNSVNTIIFSMPFMNSIYEALKSIDDYKSNSLQQDELKDAMCFEHSIQLKDASFSYPNSANRILEQANLSIQKGQAVGIVGGSGAGKSTLADVLLGILELDEGQVLCDGVDIRSFDAQWKSMMGYIPQSIYLSDDTIRNNVAFGLEAEDQNEQQVLDAIEKAQLKEFVDSLPDGIDTIIGERGVRLSGGQRQRIGIARALYNNPEILIFDEATSALDNETEKAVMESVEDLLGSKTLIIIAHRLTTIKCCDKIYRVEQGKIEEVKYEEL